MHLASRPRRRRFESCHPDRFSPGQSPADAARRPRGGPRRRAALARVLDRTAGWQRRCGSRWVGAPGGPV